MKTTGIKTPAYALDALRSEFEVTRNGISYLNHAGMSPLPTSVKRAMIVAIQAMASYGSQVYEDLLAPLVETLPIKIGEMVNAKPEEVTFVQNTSTGINLIAQSLPLQPGDNVLLCDVEFPSNVYPWQNLITKGIETRFIPSQNGGLSLDGLDAAYDVRSRVVAVSGVQFFTGRREDLREIGCFCADHDLWLVVDGIQAVGIVPIDMQEMRIAALVSGGQKAMLAPPGQGFLAIRSDLLEQLNPIFVGATSVANYEHWLQYDMTPASGAARFSLGTENIAGLAGLLASIELLLNLGVKNIAEWVTHLSALAIADLTERGYRVITPTQPETYAHIVTFAWDDDPESATAALRAQGIVLRPHQDATGAHYLRISSHGYNTEEEILRVGAMLEEIRGNTP